MKKHIKSMLVLCLLVPCMVLLMTACGDSAYKFSAIRVTEGETVTNYNLANYKAKVKDDYIKALTGVPTPNSTQIAAAKLQYEQGVLEGLADDFADAADTIFGKTFDEYYSSGSTGTIKTAISDGLLAWNATGTGTAPVGTPTINDYINAVKGTDMTALAASVYAIDNAAFTTDTLDSATKSKEAIKGVLDRLNITKTSEFFSARIAKFQDIPGASMFGAYGSVGININGNKMTIKIDAVDIFGAVLGASEEELYDEQVKIKFNVEMEISINFTKDANGIMTLADAPDMPIGAMKMVGNTIEMTIEPGVVVIFKK